MKQCAWLLGMAVGAGLLTGCVERRYVINTDPQGATVLRDGQFIGVTPLDDYYVYYGKYHFTIIKDGFEILQVEQNIPAPWYEYFPLDFFSEAVNPFPIEDRREFNYQLQPRRVVNTTELLNQAQNLRNRGIGLGAGSAQPIVPPPGGVAPPPPGAAAPAPLPPQGSTAP
jgi:hypothetical protein